METGSQEVQRRQPAALTGGTQPAPWLRSARGGASDHQAVTVQRQEIAPEEEAREEDLVQREEMDEEEEEEPVQTRAGPEREPSDEAVRQAAGRGVQSPSAPLPFAGQLQRAFGKHDVTQVQAHLGPEAAASARAMNASAYASGNHVVFSGSPTLHTVAHEAAHVVQQRQGVNLAGGVSRIGDPYEKRADAVAERVVRGQSAEDLLDGEEGHGGTEAVQRAHSVKKTSKKGGAGNKVTGITKQSKKIKKLRTSVVKNALVQGGRTMDIRFGPLKNGVATWMKANILIGDVDSLAGRGSSPSVEPPWWQNMKKSDPAIANFVSNYLVQGHLLNDNIGGPGDSMSNLTPITKSANSTHNSKVEQKVKKYFTKKGFYQIEYDVEADYDSKGPTWQNLGAPNNKIQPWLPYFPKTLHAEFAVWKKIGKRFVNLSAGEKRWTIFNDHRGLK